MSRSTTETITCDRCGKTKSIVNGEKKFDPNNVFHYDVVNPTNEKEKVDLCYDCFKDLKNIWVSFVIGPGF